MGIQSNINQLLGMAGAFASIRQGFKTKEAKASAPDQKTESSTAATESAPTDRETVMANLAAKGENEIRQHDFYNDFYKSLIDELVKAESEGEYNEQE